jgi:hypothetical protein
MVIWRVLHARVIAQTTGFHLDMGQGDEQLYRCIIIAHVPYVPSPLLSQHPRHRIRGHSNSFRRQDPSTSNDVSLRSALQSKTKDVTSRCSYGMLHIFSISYSLMVGQFNHIVQAGQVPWCRGMWAKINQELLYTTRNKPAPHMPTKIVAIRRNAKEWHHISRQE